MKTVCCVCKITVVEIIPGTQPDDGLISHGYCPACFENAMQDLKGEVITDRSRGCVNGQPSAQPIATEDLGCTS